MQNNDAAGSKPNERSDWSNAFEAVSRLVAARERALQAMPQDPLKQDPLKQAPLEAASAGAARSEPAAPSSGSIPYEPSVSLDPDQLARAVAEIEKASAVLREADPELEVWSPNAPVPSGKRKYWSIWLLIGGIWISATLVVAGATGAILYLLS
jgi:hypothetical protein